MRYATLLLLTIFASNLYVRPANSQVPPAAVPLERALKNAESVFIGRLVSARHVNGRTYYGLLVERKIIGSVEVKCLTSKFPYRIGVAYVFFVSDITNGCITAGDFLPSGLEVTSLRNIEYVKMVEPKFLYPNFEGNFFSLSSVPVGGKIPLILWTGVDLTIFEAFVRKLHPQDGNRK